MTRVRLVGLAVTALALATAAAEDKPRPKAEDPVAVELGKAMEEYVVSMEKAGDALRAAFDAQQKKLEDDKRLKVEE